MIHKFKLLHKQLALVAFVLLAELVLIGTLLNLLDQEERQARRAERAYSVTVQASLLLKEFQESIMSLLVFGLTNNQEFATRMGALSRDIPQKIEELDQSSSEFPEDKESMQQIIKAARVWQALLTQAQNILTTRAQPGLSLTIVRFLSHDVKPHMMDLTETITAFADHHKKVEIAERETMNRSKSLLRIILIAGGIMQVILAIVSFAFFSRYITRRLSILTDNAYRLASGLPLRPHIRGADEIAQLDSVFHKMAEALTTAAEKERAIVDGMPAGFFRLDKDGEINLANPRSLSMLKASSQQVIGKPLTDFVISSDDQKLSFQNIKESALGRFSEFRFLTTDNSSFPAELSINAIQDADQELLICNILDVSERYEVERMKKEFVSIVSHDLKTPLTAIQHSLYLLTLGTTLGTLNERGMKVVAGTQQEAERLVKLVTDLLDVARMEAGRIDLECALVDVGSIITRAVKSAGVLAEEKKIQLEAGDASFQVLADADRLVQVLVNFLSNAIKYSPKESIVKIECSMVPAGESANSGKVDFRVTDQGPGIPKTAQARIFGRFEQVSTEDRTEKGGTGLGLAICKLIVEAHQGTIGVDSEPGKGSSFWFEIPAAVPAAPAVPSVPEGAAVPSMPEGAAVPSEQPTASEDGAQGAAVPAVPEGAVVPNQPPNNPAL